MNESESRSSCLCAYFKMFPTFEYKRAANQRKWYGFAWLRRTCEKCAATAFSGFNRRLERERVTALPYNQCRTDCLHRRILPNRSSASSEECRRAEIRSRGQTSILPYLHLHHFTVFERTHARRLDSSMSIAPKMRIDWLSRRATAKGPQFGAFFCLGIPTNVAKEFASECRIRAFFRALRPHTWSRCRFGWARLARIACIFDKSILSESEVVAIA